MAPVRSQKLRIIEPVRLGLVCQFPVGGDEMRKAEVVLGRDLSPIDCRRIVG